MTVSLREFDKLCDEVKDQRNEITMTAVALSAIQANQKNDSKKLDDIVSNVSKISSSMDEKIRTMSKEVTLNKMQIGKLVVIITPFNAAVAYAVAKAFVGK